MSHGLPTLRMGGKVLGRAFHCIQINTEIADMHTCSVPVVLTDL